MSVERLKREHNVTTRWLHFPLHPETPEDGISLAELFAGRPAGQIEAMRQQMRERMAEAGLPYGDRTMTYNSRLAQELGAWADTVDPGEKLHDHLFRAYFVDNRNIGDKEVLVTIAGEAGLDQAEARRVLNNRLFSEYVNRDWQRAWEAGVTGVPTFTAKDLYVVGCQPYEVLVRFVAHLQNMQSGNP